MKVVPTSHFVNRGCRGGLQGNDRVWQDMRGCGEGLWKVVKGSEGTLVGWLVVSEVVNGYQRRIGSNSRPALNNGRGAVEAQTSQVICAELNVKHK